MRNHILLKFLAVMLASLMLLCAAVSGLGLLLLAEELQEDQTVETQMEEAIRQNCSDYAARLAARYASVHLGGCPEEMAGNMYRIYYNSRDFNFYGYTLLDNSGNVLDSQEPDPDYTGEPYRFTGSWEYMYLLSAVSEDQLDQQNLIYSLTIENEENPVGDYLDGTADVSEFRFSYDGGSSSSAGSDRLGVLTHEDGAVVFRVASPDVLEDLLELDAIDYICFLDAGGDILYECSFPGYSGILTPDGDGSGTIRMQSGGVSDAYVTVFRAEFTGDQDVVLDDDSGLGVFYYDLYGYAVFRAKGASIASDVLTGPVRGLALYGEDYQLIYSSFQTEDVGTLFFDGMDRLCFTSSAPARAVARTALEARPVLETAAETETAETVPETPTVMEIPDSTDVAILPTEPQRLPVPARTEAPADPADISIPETQSDETVLIAGKSLEDYEVHTASYYDALGEEMSAYFVYVPLEDYTVELYMAPKASFLSAWNLLKFAYQNQVAVIAAFGVSLLLFALLAVYLCSVAGHAPGVAEIRAGGLNRMPLDLYGGLAVLGIGVIVVMIVEGLDYLLGRGAVGISILCYGGYVCALLLVGFCFAFAAQVKTPGLFLIRNSLCGRLWHLAVILLKHLWRGCLRILRKIRNLCRRIGASCAKIYGLLPLTWQWLLTACGLLLILLIAFLSGNGFMILLGLLISTAIVLYGSYSFGILLQGARRMRSGDLEQKVDARGLIGSFREFAQELNGLSEVAVVAAREQMKSERMRSELITNVSHDIKTPLTSIINFVDLLQKPHTDEEEKSYLEVLSRQSDRLKKLIDDLMEMSKASTGNLNVDISQVDAAEAVNQALGEFGDKLASVNLTPIFHQPKEPVMMLADGRLAWRAMSNLLGNAVKYALPGTRLYIDLSEIDGNVMISFKNISRDQLNISADELMERFVRGDTSRNTEGSGLGLNIAKSLMELQKGKLQLLVDGDLFKATLVFPAG